MWLQPWMRRGAAPLRLTAAYCGLLRSLRFGCGVVQWGNGFSRSFVLFRALSVSCSESVGVRVRVCACARVRVSERIFGAYCGEFGPAMRAGLVLRLVEAYSSILRLQ